MQLTQHPQAAEASQTGNRARDRWCEPLLAVLIVALMLVPRAAPLLLVIAVLALAASAWRRGELRGQALFQPDLMASAFLALAGFAAASQFWQWAPGNAWQQGAGTAGIILLTWLGAHSLPSRGSAAQTGLVRALLAGFSVGLGLLLFELFTGQALHRWLYNAIPVIRPHESEFIQRQGLVLKIRAEQINRSVAVSALLLWPMLGLIWELWRGQARLTAVVLLVGATGMLVLASPHESSKLALLLSFGVGVVAVWSGRAGWWLTAASWVGLVLLCVPLAQASFQARLYENTGLQDSARARLILWGYSASKVSDAPWFGIGAGAGRVLDDRRGAVEPLPGQPFGLRTGPHQHNVFLQVWYELGAVGALLMLAAGALLIGRIGRLAGAGVPFALAGVMAAMAMAAVSYGLWQAWFQAIMAWPLLVALLWVRPPRYGATAEAS